MRVLCPLNRLMYSKGATSKSTAYKYINYIGFEWRQAMLF